MWEHAWEHTWEVRAAAQSVARGCRAVQCHAKVDDHLLRVVRVERVARLEEGELVVVRLVLPAAPRGNTPLGLDAWVLDAAGHAAPGYATIHECTLSSAWPWLPRAVYVPVSRVERVGAGTAAVTLRLTVC